MISAVLIIAGAISLGLARWYMKSYAKSDMPLEPLKSPSEPVLEPEPVLPTPEPEPMPEDPKTVLRPWGDPKDNYHNTRVLCDRAGLTVTQKNLICACIYQESNFYNILPNGKPVKFENRKDGKVWSTDWGIVQINDTKGWHIGPGLPFSSVQYVLDNPQKAVQYMIDMYKKGKLNLWSSYKFGHYKQWLVPTSPMWKLKS